ncbi:MAG: sigma-54-dependent Fis family transcriptional regulator [gamma proteobacterium symbiont of Phacoides pectinatus]
MSRHPLALVVDDEPDICELIGITLSRMGIDTQSAHSIRSARQLLARQAFDFCLTDMRLPDGDGIDLVRHISTTLDQLPVAVITAHGNMESAVEALNAGAFDFVSKPVDLKSLRKLVDSALRLNRPGEESAAEDADDGSGLIGDSPALHKVRSMIAKLARSQAPVYISGESGTGKELAARMIHRQGPRRAHPFVAVNCGAIPQELMESELFGHRKGSFTGAHADKQGLFQAAAGGTLFLDEIADLPLHMQVKLLRAIQEKHIRPVGASAEEPIDVRIISATHKALSEKVASGEFRQDLYYRLNVIELAIPPLRERPEDIPLLTGWILDRQALRWGMEKPAIAREAEALLGRYPFPGNVRELENILERALTLTENNSITEEDLQLPGTGVQPAPDLGNAPLEQQLEAIERTAITEALEATHWNKTAAAKRLGMSFRSLRYRPQKLGIDQGE